MFIRAHIILIELFLLKLYSNYFFFIVHTLFLVNCRQRDHYIVVYLIMNLVCLTFFIWQVRSVRHFTLYALDIYIDYRIYVLYGYVSIVYMRYIYVYNSM